MSKLNYPEFIDKVSPQGGIFTRKELGLTNNCCKWLALRCSFVLYRMGLTANLLDVLGVPLSLFGFYLTYTGATQSDYLVTLAGTLLIYFHVFIDYLDGAIAKTDTVLSPIGGIMDDIGCTMARNTYLILISILTQNILIEFSMIFSTVILFVLTPGTIDDIPNTPLMIKLKKVYQWRYSFLGIRFLLLFLPLCLLSSVFFNLNIILVCKIISALYIILASIWLLLCIPEYKKR
jgi:phosphatidylglycerophosphate synthase